jgi:hypothetical protein
LKSILTGILFALFSFFSYLYGQGITNLYLGGFANNLSHPYGGFTIDMFGGSPDTLFEQRIMNFSFTASNISDSLGNLLFSTNGVFIMNAANDTIMNGDSLNPSVYTSNWSDGLLIPQANLILPDVQNPDRFYLYHMTIDDNIQLFSTFFYYSIVDISLDGGLGEVIDKNHIIINDSLSGTGITASKHANGRDWWIIIPKRFNQFYVFLHGPGGPMFNYSFTVPVYNYRVTQACFSPDGTKYALYNTDSDFELMDFDRCTGMLSNYRQVVVNDSMVCFGAAFSPNSQYLYGSSGRFLYQIDATSNQPDTTLTTVAVWDTFFSPNPPFATLFFLQQLANDGKIYLATMNSTLAWHVIDSPDNQGTASNVLQHSITLPSYNDGTMMNHPNYNLGPLIGSPCDTLTGLSEAYTQKPLALKVFPNPVYGNELEINYSLEQNMQGALEILNVTGKLVYEKTLPQWSSYQRLHLPELSSGVYLVKLSSGNKIATVKFIKAE